MIRISLKSRRRNAKSTVDARVISDYAETFTESLWCLIDPGSEATLRSTGIRILLRDRTEHGTKSLEKFVWTMQKSRRRKEFTSPLHVKMFRCPRIAIATSLTHLSPSLPPDAEGDCKTRDIQQPRELPLVLPLQLNEKVSGWAGYAAPVSVGQCFVMRPCRHLPTSFQYFSENYGSGPVQTFL